MSIYINEQMISDAMLLEEINHYQENVLTKTEKYRMPREEMMQHVKQHLIQKILLYQEAQKRQTTATISEETLQKVSQEITQQAKTRSFRYALPVPSGKQTLESLREYITTNLKIEQLLDEVCQEIIPPGEEELKVFYEDNMGAYITPERFWTVEWTASWKHDHQKQNNINTLETSRNKLKLHQTSFSTFLKEHAYSTDSTTVHAKRSFIGFGGMSLYL